MARPGMFKRYVSTIILSRYRQNFVSENNNGSYGSYGSYCRNLVVVVNRHHNACMFGQFLLSNP